MAPFYFPPQLYSLALANRSAALLRVGLLADALDDLDAALALGSHPKPDKLEERRRKCADAMRTAATQNGMQVQRGLYVVP